MSSAGLSRYCAFMIAASFFLPGLGKAQDMPCPQPDTFELRVTPVHGEPKFDVTKSFAEIERLAGPVIAAKHYPLLGMALQGFGLAHSVTAEASKREDGLLCAALSIVEIRIGWADRTVFIAREASENACVYETALEHQLRHVRSDDAILDAFVPVFTRELRGSLEQLNSAPFESSELANKNLTDAVVALARGLLGPLEQERSRIRQTLDLSEELDRIREGCGGIEIWLRERASQG
jgi:hypothetical protein